MNSITARKAAAVFVASSMVLSSFSAIATPIANAQAVPNCDGDVPATLAVDVFQHISNDPDSANAPQGGNWALDDFTRQIQIWQEPGSTDPNAYCAEADDTGTFTTFGGANGFSPQSGAALPDVVTGTMVGGTGRMAIEGTLGDAGSWGNTPPAIDCTTDAATCAAGLTSLWMNNYFGSDSFNYPDWSWTYTSTPSCAGYGVWVNSTVSTGDIAEGTNTCNQGNNNNAGDNGDHHDGDHGGNGDNNGNGNNNGDHGDHGNGGNNNGDDHGHGGNGGNGGGTGITTPPTPPPPPAPTTATVVATNIVCPTEAMLPNLSDTGATITASTATAFLAANPTCSAQQGWNFEVAQDGTANPGDNLEVGGAGWTPFGPTDVNGVASTTVGTTTTLWFREQLKSGFVPFAGLATTSTVSAEMYCGSDVSNYDNFDSIGGFVAGQTYYCVAFNAPAPILAPTSDTTPPPSDTTNSDSSNTSSGSNTSGGNGGGGGGTISGPLSIGFVNTGGTTNGGLVLGTSTDATGGSTTCGPLLSTYIGMGKNNNPAQVKLLQTFLNTQIGSTLTVNGVFDAPTEVAVKDFQLKYWEDILAPWKPFGLGDHQPTGYVYKTTERMINLLSCSALNTPLPQLP